jgi:membrane-bound ClpP family serine protease
MIDGMDDAQRIIPARRPPRFQFNLKFVLAVMAACAVSAAVVPFDWQPFCPLSMVVLVIGSVVINLSFWGHLPGNPLRILGTLLLVAGSAAIAFCATCCGVGLFTINPIVARPIGMHEEPTLMQVYIFATAWWLGGIAACIVANYVLIRRRQRAHREMHWSERQTDGRQ